ncbi:MAG: hypothetical protein MZV63_24295 [Marinilabiliales bacterium]|nr:hypothetical protein [Marinilabiliales bacterium]
MENTVYYNTDGGYAYWNVITGGTTGYSDIVAPMQGFFVHVTSSTATTLTLPVEYKTITPALPLRSKSSMDKSNQAKNSIKKIKLSVNNESLADETIICLIGDATLGFDGEYDAYKFHNVKTEAPSFYTELGSTKYAINAVPEPDGNSNSIVPLAIDIKKAGTYTISASEFENLDNIPVTLKHGTVETNLGAGSSYTFTAETGTLKTFKLIFGKSDDRVNNSGMNHGIVTWYSNEYLYVSPDSEISSDRCDIILL